MAQHITGRGALDDSLWGPQMHAKNNWSRFMESKTPREICASLLVEQMEEMYHIQYGY